MRDAVGKGARVLAGGRRCGLWYEPTVLVGAPMGGWKPSGIGSRNGVTICSPRLPTPKRELVWFPYGGPRRRVVERVTRLVNGRGLRRSVAPRG